MLLTVARLLTRNGGRRGVGHWELLAFNPVVPLPTHHPWGGGAEDSARASCAPGESTGQATASESGQERRRSGSGILAHVYCMTLLITLLVNFSRPSPPCPPSSSFRSPVCTSPVPVCVHCARFSPSGLALCSSSPAPRIVCLPPTTPPLPPLLPSLPSSSHSLPSSPIAPTSGCAVSVVCNCHLVIRSLHLLPPSSWRGVCLHRAIHDALPPLHDLQPLTVMEDAEHGNRPSPAWPLWTPQTTSPVSSPSSIHSNTTTTTTSTATMMALHAPHTHRCTPRALHAAFRPAAASMEVMVNV